MCVVICYTNSVRLVFAGNLPYQCGAYDINFKTLSPSPGLVWWMVLVLVFMPTGCPYAATSLTAINTGDGDRDSHKLHIYIVVTWEDISYTPSDQDICIVYCCELSFHDVHRLMYDGPQIVVIMVQYCNYCITAENVVTIISDFFVIHLHSLF
jgi:hypothetical protein